MNIYGLFENSEEVFRGDAQTIADKYCVQKNTVYQCEISGRLLDKRYEVKYIESVKPKIVTERMIVNTTSFEDNVREIIRRLRIYGNTTLPKIKNSELQKYLDALKESGYECNVKGYSMRTGNQIKLEGSPFDKTKYDTNYIVELKEGK